MKRTASAVALLAVGLGSSACAASTQPSVKVTHTITAKPKAKATKSGDELLMDYAWSQFSDSDKSDLCLAMTVESRGDAMKQLGTDDISAATEYTYLKSACKKFYEEN